MSTRISRQSFEFIFIRNRIELHPNATSVEIAASLELDGVEVPVERVRQVMEQIQSSNDRIEESCRPQKRGEAASAGLRHGASRRT